MGYDIDGLLARLDQLPPREHREAMQLLGSLDDDPVPHTDYQQDPVGWAEAHLGIDPRTLLWSLNDGYADHHWDGTEDPLMALYAAVAAWKDVGVESGTGTGKSYAVAILILWFLACWENALAFTFAPAEKQLKLYIWKNIGEMWPQFQRHFPTAQLTELCIRMRGGTDESWAAHGYAVGIRADEKVATRAAGMHGPHMLLVYEETPGIPAQVLEAGENTCTAPHNIRVAIGNPNHRLDPLHKFCTSAGVVHVRASALDHPNVVTGNDDLVPGAISRKSIDRRRQKYGESSPVYQSRVRGESPEQASDALVRLEWLDRAAARFQARRAAGTIPTVISGKGVDVANSEHGDRACIVDFSENVCIRVDAFQCPDANKLGRQVVLEIDGSGLAPMRVGIDTIGVGAGTVNECHRLGRHVQALNASAAPTINAEKVADGKVYEWAADANIFRNLRSQMYWQCREDFRNDTIDVEYDQELWEELTCPTFVDEPKTLVEPKEEIRERLGRSPDKADAFVMANWVRARAVAPPKPIIAKDRSPGYDYAKHQPRERQTAEQEVALMIQRAQPYPTAGRHRIPRR